MCFANRISARLTSLVSFFSSFRCWQWFYYFVAQDKQLSHLEGATLHLSQRCSSRPFPPSLINSTENKKIWKKHVVWPDRGTDCEVCLEKTRRTNRTDHAQVMYCLESYRCCILCKAEESHSRTPLSKEIKPPLNWFWMQMLFEPERCFCWKIL